MEGKKLWRWLRRFVGREERKVEKFIEYEETLLAKWGYWFLKAVFGTFRI